MDVLLGGDGESIPNLTDAQVTDGGADGSGLNPAENSGSEKETTALTENTANDSGSAGDSQSREPSLPVYDEYVVIKGDNYSTIIRKFNGLRISDLQQANPDVDPTRLQIGQTLKIPRSSLAVNKSNASDKVEATALEKTGNFYKIQTGDTLSKVASQFGVSVPDLMTANPNIDPLRLQINQPIAIPEKKAVAVASNQSLALKPGQKVYTISKGDNLFNIASSNGISVRDIQTANPDLDPLKLRVGTPIVIPSKAVQAQNPGNGAAPEPKPESGKDVYVVQAGDNLKKISSQYNISVSQLMQHNKLLTTRINPGQQLSIPVSDSSTMMARSEQP
jgi:LysM repeat protein